jgi:signal transduction histidine kinase
MGKLKTRLVFQFVFLTLAGVLMVGMVTFWTTNRTFQEYVFNQQMTRASAFVPLLTQYYEESRSWDGVQHVLNIWHPGVGAISHGMGRRMGGRQSTRESTERIMLFDAVGNVKYDSYPLGGNVPQVILDNAVEIYVGDVAVGSVLVTSAAPGGGAVGYLEERYLHNVEIAMVVSGLVSLAVAILLALRLAGGLSRPIQRLRDALQKVAAGEYENTIQIDTLRSPQEVQDLVSGFNAMSSELKIAELRKKDMLRDIAHEIKTPLTILSGNLEAVSMGVLEADKEMLVGMLEEISRLDALVTNINTLDELSSKSELNKKVLDVHSLVQRTVNSVRGMSQSKGIKVSAHVEEGISGVLADEQKIQQVFTNLISNAIRYTPENGEILILARPGHVDNNPRQDWIEFSVEDSGPGIPEKDLYRVFERFFRGDRSRSRATGGTGLGLSIAHDLVEQMGGTIWAENLSTQGAAFRFLLPAGEVGQTR